MARHRNVRRLDFDEGKFCTQYFVVIFDLIERDFGDIYGRSLEDEVAISPATACKCVCVCVCA